MSTSNPKIASSQTNPRIAFFILFCMVVLSVIGIGLGYTGKGSSALSGLGNGSTPVQTTNTTSTTTPTTKTTTKTITNKPSILTSSPVTSKPTRSPITPKPTIDLQTMLKAFVKNENQTNSNQIYETQVYENGLMNVATDFEIVATEISPDGTIYVGLYNDQTGNCTIHMYDSNFFYLDVLYPSKLCEMSAIHKSGQFLFVSHRSGYNIDMYDSNNRYVKSFDVYIPEIANTGIFDVYTKNDKLYVVAYDENVYEFSVSNGNFIQKFNLGSKVTAIKVHAGPTSMHVVDYSNNQIITRFNNGTITKWGGIGFGDTQFHGIRDIAISADHMYILDTGNSRVMKYDNQNQLLQEWNMNTLHKMRSIDFYNGNLYLTGLLAKSDSKVATDPIIVKLNNI